MRPVLRLRARRAVGVGAAKAGRKRANACSVAYALGRVGEGIAGASVVGVADVVVRLYGGRALDRAALKLRLRLRVS